MENIELEHSAYGMVKISRVHGSANLHACHMDQIESFYELEIHQGVIQHHLSHDWLFARGRSIVKIALSPAQFMNLLTNMNTADGVPCTLEYVDGKPIPEIPVNEEKEIHRIQKTFARDIKTFASDLNVKVKEGLEILEKGSKMTKEDRTFLGRILGEVDREINSNWTYVLDQFERCAKKIIVEGKAEFDSFITGAVQRLGFEKLIEIKNALLLTEWKKE